MSFELKQFLFIKGLRNRGVDTPPTWFRQLANVSWRNEITVSRYDALTDIGDFLPIENRPTMNMIKYERPLDRIGKVIDKKGKSAWLKIDHKNVDERLNFHSHDRPAFKSGDVELWFSHGVHFDSRFITFLKEDAEHIDPKRVLAIDNVDVRREVIRKIGVERVLDGLYHRVVDKEGNYELLDVIIGSDMWNNARFLKMLNPSIGVWHLEGVPNDCATVQAALLRRNNNWFAHAKILT